MQYSELVLKHFFDPQCVGEFTDLTDVITITRGQKSQGYQLQLQLKIQQRKVIDARFKAYGDPVLIACASFVAMKSIGSPVTALTQFDADFLLSELRLPTVKRHAALLVEQAICDVIQKVSV